MIKKLKFIRVIFVIFINLLLCQTGYLTEDFNEYKGFKIPDFTNKDTGYSISILNQNNINYTVVGGGKIIKNQYPKYGSVLYENSEVILYTE